MYGYSTHPYTYPAKQGVGYRPPDSNQVTIGTLSRLSNALNLAGRRPCDPGAPPDPDHRVRRAVEAEPRRGGAH